MLDEYISLRDGIDLFKYKIELNLQENDNVFLLGMPGIGKTHFLLDYKLKTLKKNTEDIVVYIDTVQYLMWDNSIYFHDYLIQEINNEYNKDLKYDNKYNFLKDLKSKTNQVIIIIDHIDGLSLNNIKTCDEDKLKGCLETIDQLKYWARNSEALLIFCGRRHFIAANEALEKEFNAQQTHDLKLKKKLNIYTSIVAASGPFNTRHYLRGLSTNEIELFCKKTIKKRLPLSKNLKSSITKLSTEVHSKIGNHPKMISQFLISLIVGLKSFDEIIKERALSQEEFDRLISSSLASSTPTLNDICRSIYKYSIENEEKRILSEIIVSNRNASTDDDSANILIEKGILIMNNQIEFFSPFFTKLLSHELKTEKLIKNKTETISIKKHIIQIEKNGEIITELSGKAGELFHLMHQAEGQFISKDELLMKLYGGSNDPNPLYQLKNNLQRKIDKLFEIDSKELGYKLVPKAKNIFVKIKQ